MKRKMVNGLTTNIQGRKRIKFRYEIMKKSLESLMPALPTADECLKFISYSGGVCIDLIYSINCRKRNNRRPYGVNVKNR